MARRKTLLELPKFPTLEFEQKLWVEGIDCAAGLDEAGRGAWAGPVCAGAVVLPQVPELAARLAGVRDSKQMSAKARAKWAEFIRAEALGWGVGFASNQEIDALGILPATRLAMTRALAECAARLPAGLCVRHLLIDALRLPEVDLPQTALIKGDARVLSIAAASVLAKTARDALLVGWDQDYPGYGFARHKGYGTRLHQEALRRCGPTLLHRFSFAPLKALQAAAAEETPKTSRIASR